MLLPKILLVFLIWIPKIIVSLTTDDVITLATTYRTPKNIAFSTQGGGSSHHMWVFEILKEMHNRGHNVSFFSRGDQLPFAKDYPMIKIKQVGGPAEFMHHPVLVKHISSHPRQDTLAIASAEACMTNFPSEFYEHKALFESENTDLVICDSFAISCIDTATFKKLPIVITSTFGIYADFSAPYINNRLFTFTNPTSENDSRKLGLTPTVDASDPRYNDIPKLLNNVFGIEVARKLSPLFHMVGPIMRNTYPSLDASTATFLDSHKRVAYLAFGQHAWPSDQDVKMVMQTLLRLLDKGKIDGIIWARLTKDRIPEMIETPTKSYSHHDIANHPDFYLIDWAPQYAILQHPSVSFFISHGGAASMHESLYSGKRLFIYPFFGDQPYNARAIERIGVGGYIDTFNMKYDNACYELLYKNMYDVATDPQNTIQNAVNQYTAYIQVSAVNAVTRAADLLEESLFASDDQGKLYYRYDVGHEFNWIRRNNVDVFAVFSVFGLIASFLLWNFLQTNLKKAQKLKTL